MIFFLAFRNLTRRLRRYAFMGLAVSVAFALITVVTGAAYGALESVKDKAARYFAGHISVTGFLPGLKQEITDPAGVMDVLEKSGLPIRTMAKRTVYYQGDAQLFFGGETVLQRKLIGVDLEAEGTEFSTLPFREGGWQALARAAEPGILLSVTAAELMNCRVGDGITLYITTDSGQYNTAELIVRGIFQETSLFGYASYMRRQDLNRLLLREAGAATDIAVYLETGTNSAGAAQNAIEALSGSFAVAPLFTSREQRDEQLAAIATEPILVVLTQDAQLAQIRQFIDAFLGITYFVLIIFMIIVMVGILNTYRVLVHERRREIGVLRALGMGRKRIRRLFITEASLLALASSAVGLTAGAGILALLSKIDLSFIPGSGLFLESGRMRFELNILIICTNCAVMLAVAAAAAWGPARRAGNIRPAEAIRST